MSGARKRIQEALGDAAMALAVVRSLAREHGLGAYVAEDVSEAMTHIANAMGRMAIQDVLDAAKRPEDG